MKRPIFLTFLRCAAESGRFKEEEECNEEEFHGLKLRGMPTCTSAVPPSPSICEEAEICLRIISLAVDGRSCQRRLAEVSDLGNYFLLG